MTDNHCKPVRQCGKKYETMIYVNRESGYVECHSRYKRACGVLRDVMEGKAMLISTGVSWNPEHEDELDEAMEDLGTQLAGKPQAEILTAVFEALTEFYYDSWFSDRVQDVAAFFERKRKYEAMNLALGQ